MRILITTPVYPPDLGGPATFVPRFAGHLARHGHQVVVLAFADGPVASAPGFEVVTVPRVFLPLRYARFFARALQLAARADLLFACEHPRIFTIAAARLLRRILVLRVMVDTAWELSFRRGYTTDGPETFRRRRQRLAARLLQRLQTWSLKRADLVVAVSEHLGRMARQMGVPPERVLVSYNLPPAGWGEPSREEARRALGVPDAPFQLLVVTRLIPWKGVDGVLDAVETLADPCRMVIVGDGPERRRLADRIARSPLLRSRVELAGAVGRDTVRLHMRASDLLVLNSTYEGLSHVLLEAMAAGLPVAASDTAGNREIITDGDNGLLFAVGDVQGLVREIERLRADAPARARFVARSQRRLTAWNEEHSLRRLAATLQQVAAGDA